MTRSAQHRSGRRRRFWREAGYSCSRERLDRQLRPAHRGRQRCRGRSVRALERGTPLPISRPFRSSLAIARGPSRRWVPPLRQWPHPPPVAAIAIDHPYGDPRCVRAQAGSSQSWGSDCVFRKTQPGRLTQGVRDKRAGTAMSRYGEPPSRRPVRVSREQRR